MANSNFIDYTTSGAFNLSLSRRQINTFAYYASVEHFPYIPSKSTQSLIDKGLLELVPADVSANKSHASLRITAEGKHVWALLKMARLAEEFPPSVYLPEPEVEFNIELQPQNQPHEQWADALKAAATGATP